MKVSLLRAAFDTGFLVVAIGLTLGLSACASTTIDDAVSRGASAGPRKSGEYPNINIERRAATTQMSDAERAAIVERLSTAGAAGAGSSRSNGAAEEGRLRTLAERHGEDTLKQIEGSD